MFTFCKTPTYQSDDNFILNVSDDGRALTATFSDLVVTVGGSKSPTPISTRVFNLVLPIKGDGEQVEIEFAIQGFSLTLEGTTASIVSSVNGQTTVTDIPANSEQSFTHQLKFAAPSASECRLSVFLLAGQDNNSNAEAFLNVLSIDAEFLPRPQ